MQLYCFFFFLCRIKGDAGFSHLLKSIPLKLFKAEDVQDANFESGVAGTKKNRPNIMNEKGDVACARPELRTSEAVILSTHL